MKLRIIEKGWETYTAALGSVQFENGVSVGDVTLQEARHLAGNLSIIDVATGLNPSATQHMVDTYNDSAVAEVVQVVAQVVEAVKAVSGVVHTFESLSAIANEKGIKGLREVAPEGASARSIKDMIDAILNKQGA